MTAPLVFGAAAFAACAWFGVRAAGCYLADCIAFNDGPEPIAVADWPFAAAGALLGAAIGARVHDPGALALIAVMTVALAACAYADLRWGIVPDAFVIPALGIACAVALVHRDLGALGGAVVASVPFAVTAVLSRGRGLGWGDVKLAALGGAMLGAPAAIVAMIAGSLCAAIVAIVLRRAQRPIAFAPYLIVAFGIAIPTIRTG